MSIRVLLISDEPAYGRRLVQTLGTVSGFSVLGAVSGWQQAREQFAARSPSVVVLDLAAERPFEGMALARVSLPYTRIVALTEGDDEADLVALAESGIAGCVPRHGSLGDIIACIEAASRGELHCSAAVAGSLLQRLAEVNAARSHDSLIDCLTPREQHILDLVEQGLSNKQIARAATIEVATVKNHIHNILEKLGVQRRGEAAAVLRRAMPRQPFDTGSLPHTYAHADG